MKKVIDMFSIHIIPGGHFPIYIPLLKKVEQNFEIYFSYEIVKVEQNFEIYFSYEIVKVEQNFEIYFSYEIVKVGLFISTNHCL
jgi:hypothetical protein